MGLFSTKTCEHLTDGIAQPDASACQDCGSTFSLRACTECGYVGCCVSQQAHNRRHWQQTGHPVIKSLPLGDGSFTYCWECRKYVRT